VVVVSYSGREINAKLVYYGAGLSGKTTNLEAIYEAVPENSRGKMVSMKTQSDRTLFFDLLPLDLGEIMGFKTRFLLYTVPGQVFYNATRKLVLKGADAIVFVADSQRGKMDENKESLQNLRANLAEYGLQLEDIPWAIQYNKRDLPDVYSVEELNAELNPDGKVPCFEAIAMNGKGVFETFRGVSHLLMEKVARELRRGPSSPRGRNEQTIGVEAPKPEIILPDVSADPVTPTSARAAEPADDPNIIGRDIELPNLDRPVQTSGDISDRTYHGADISLPAAAAEPVGKPKAVPVRAIAGSTEARAANGHGAEEIVVPIELPPGCTEVVIRLVVKDARRAEAA